MVCSCILQLLNRRKFKAQYKCGKSEYKVTNVYENPQLLYTMVIKTMYACNGKNWNVSASPLSQSSDSNRINFLHTYTSASFWNSLIMIVCLGYASS